MAFDRKTLIIPDNTIFEEHTIITKGDVIVSDRAKMDYGAITSGRIFIGNKTKISGSLVADEDVHVDMWSQIEGDLTSKGSVYLADKVKVSGKLSVMRDLDIGDDVDIENGFEAKGWINIRNPIPLVVYLFIYLLELMRVGKEKDVDKILEELQKTDEMIVVSDEFLFIPCETVLGLQQTVINGKCKVGDNCRVLGNYKASGSFKLGNSIKIFGALRSERNVIAGKNCEIHGDVDALGVVCLKEGCHVFGNIRGKKIELGQNVVIDGMLNADEGVQFISEVASDMQTKAERAEKEAHYDVQDLLA